MRSEPSEIGGGCATMETVLIAMMLYDGVLRDECDAFRTVLSRVSDAEFTTVAAVAGQVGGIGGVQHAAVGFDEFIANPHPLEVIVVPGGAGCERAAEDPQVRRFLTVMGGRARLIAGSSTGSVILAGAGLLRGEPASTHWLAATLLRRYGSEVDHRQIAIHRNVITCEGRVSAVEAALAVVERIENPKAADRIRAEILVDGAALLRPPTVWQRATTWLRSPWAHRRSSTDRGAADEHSGQKPGSTPPSSVLIELVDDAETVKWIRDNARRRRDN